MSPVMTRSLLLACCFSALCVGPAITQPADSSELDEPETPGSAVDLQILPRVGVGYTSSGPGFDGATHVEGFLPLLQTPGQRLTFLAGQFALDNDAHLGGTVLLGHRIYDAGGDRIWGGYVAFDHRETDYSSFDQLGLGLESLGEVWDFRLNGYVPLGDTRRLIDQQQIDGGTQLSADFQGHLLMLESQHTQHTIRTYEAALGGLDAEVGARLARWNGGDLRGYVGAYLYGGSDRDSTLGWRVRLDADPTDNLNLGVSLQNDDRFGTNVMVSMALRFPGTRPRGPLSEADTVVARLGDPVGRTASIVVDHDQDVETSVSRRSAPLMNPEEDAPYWFQHVELGRATGGNGTIEHPFSTVEAAFGATRSDGNDVVYVDAGTQAIIPALTIPDRVQVLSRGPAQFLAGLPFAEFPLTPVRLPFSPSTNYDNGIWVQLPLSETGEFPVIQDTTVPDLVTLGDRTTLAGFQLLHATGNAIAGDGIEDAELRNTIIHDAGERGIFLNNSTGSLVLFDNSITTVRGGAAAGQGILLQNAADDAVDVTMRGLDIQDSRVGIELTSRGDRTQGMTPDQNIHISDAQIDGSRDQGMLIRGDGPGNQQVTFDNGRIEASGADGVVIHATNIASQEVTLSNTTITQNGGAGIRVEAGVLDGSSTAAQEVFIRQNTITTNAGDGIAIEGNEVVAQELAIGNNVIADNGGAGIRAIANNLAFQEYVTDADNGSAGISNNQIRSNGGPGIELTANDNAALIVDVQGNRLSRNQPGNIGDITIATTSGATTTCVVAINNTATSIRFDNNRAGAAGLFEVGDLNDLSVNNTVDTITLLPNSSAFTNRANARSCF